MLMGGMSMGGTAVTMKGELTGADCYLSTGDHAMATHSAQWLAYLTEDRSFLSRATGQLIWSCRPKTARIIPCRFWNDLG